jgi:putative spermidine/putrescine transport system permease protein
VSLPVSPRRVARTVGIGVTVALAVCLVAPLIVTAAGAFVDADWYGKRSEGVGAVGAAGLFRYVLDHWSGALVTSLQLVGTVVPLALLVGAPAAFAFRRRPFPGSGFLETLAMTPLAIPGIALAVGLLLGGGRTPRFGLLVAGHLAYTLPLVLKTVSNALERESEDLDRAARSLGAGPWETAAWVTIPRLVPGLVLSALLVFAVSWGEFNVSFLLASPIVQTFPAGLYLTYTTNSFPVAAAATLIFLAPILPAFLAIQALGGEEFRRGLSI